MDGIDPEGTYGKQGYQLFNALLSYGTAGLWGHGMETALINLPEAQTTLSFAVIALSFGFIGGGFTILAICVFDILLIRIGFKSQNNRDNYFTAGIFGLLIFQQVWNIGIGSWSLSNNRYNLTIFIIWRFIITFIYDCHGYLFRYGKTNTNY